MYVTYMQIISNAKRCLQPNYENYFIDKYVGPSRPYVLSPSPEPNNMNTRFYAQLNFYSNVECMAYIFNCKLITYEIERILFDKLTKTLAKNLFNNNHTNDHRQCIRKYTENYKFDFRFILICIKCGYKYKHILHMKYERMRESKLYEFFNSNQHTPSQKCFLRNFQRFSQVSMAACMR